jgi:hypothetical protein
VVAKNQQDHPGLVQLLREDDRRDEHRRAGAVGNAERERDARDGDDDGADAQDQPDAAVLPLGLRSSGDTWPSS